MMTYSELITKRRSIRDFEDKPVPPAVIQEILQEACLAPRACNLQPWKFDVLQLILAKCKPSLVAINKSISN